MTPDPNRLVTCVDPAPPRGPTFVTFVCDLVAGLARRGIRFVRGAHDTVILEGRPMNRVAVWQSGRAIGLECRPTGCVADSPVRPEVGGPSPRWLEDRIPDRRARRPSADRARAVYRDPTCHLPNFQLLLRTLALARDDDPHEVGCGGGALTSGTGAAPRSGAGRRA